MNFCFRWKFLDGKAGKITTMGCARTHYQDKQGSQVCAAYSDDAGNATRFCGLPLTREVLAIIHKNCYPAGANHLGQGGGEPGHMDDAGSSPDRAGVGGAAGNNRFPVGGHIDDAAGGRNGVSDVGDIGDRDQPMNLDECMPGFDGAKCINRAPSAKAFSPNGGTPHQQVALQICLNVTHTGAQRKWNEADIAGCLSTHGNSHPPEVQMLPKTAAQLRTLMTDSVPVPTEYRYNYCPTHGCNRLYRVEMRDNEW